jgi:hypothetical protein
VWPCGALIFGEQFRRFRRARLDADHQHARRPAGANGGRGGVERIGARGRAVAQHEIQTLEAGADRNRAGDDVARAIRQIHRACRVDAVRTDGADRTTDGVNVAEIRAHHDAAALAIADVGSHHRQPRMFERLLRCRKAQSGGAVLVPHAFPWQRRIVGAGDVRYRRDHRSIELFDACDPRDVNANADNCHHA